MSNADWIEKIRIAKRGHDRWARSEFRSHEERAASRELEGIDQIQVLLDEIDRLNGVGRTDVPTIERIGLNESCPICPGRCLYGVPR